MAQAQPPDLRTDRLADLAVRFTYHKPNDYKAGAHQQVRNALLEIAVELDALLPEGREKSLVFTKLEEAMFWANAAIARREVG